MDIDAQAKHIRYLLEFEAWARPLLEGLALIKNAAFLDVEPIKAVCLTDLAPQLEPEVQPEQPASEEPVAEESATKEPAEAVTEGNSAGEAAQPETPPAA